jgi:hypothetical protein
VAEALARKGNNHFPRGRVNVVDVAIMVVPVMRTQRMLAGLVLPRLRGRVGRGGETPALPGNRRTIDPKLSGLA